MSTRPSVVPLLRQDTRQRYKLAFDTDQAHLYHDVRPGYQHEILEFLTGVPPKLAFDLGAGTGLFTSHLSASGADVVAVDPAANMLAVLAKHNPKVTTIVSTVETLDTTPWRAAADLVVAAQSWHWIDTTQGIQKVAQLLTEQGVFGVVHHQIDTSIPWVLRLCKIMHSGDIHPVEDPPSISSVFTHPVGKWWHWEQVLTVDQIQRLMMSRAFYLRTNNQQRARMHSNLEWYLLEYLGYDETAGIRIPYITAAWRMRKAQLGAAR